MQFNKYTHTHTRTHSHEGQRLTSSSQPVEQTNKDSNHDKLLTLSNHSQISEIYQFQDDAFGYKLQSLLSGLLQATDKTVRNGAHLSKTFSSFWRVARNRLRHFQHANFIAIVGVGKEETHINWSMARPEKAASVTGTTLKTNNTGSVPADSQQ